MTPPVIPINPSPSRTEPRQTELIHLKPAQSQSINKFNPIVVLPDAPPDVRSSLPKMVTCSASPEIKPSTRNIPPQQFQYNMARVHPITAQYDQLNYKKLEIPTQDQLVKFQRAISFYVRFLTQDKIEDIGLDAANVLMNYLILKYQQIISSAAQHSRHRCNYYAVPIIKTQNQKYIREYTSSPRLSQHFISQELFNFSQYSNAFRNEANGEEGTPVYEPTFLEDPKKIYGQLLIQPTEQSRDALEYFRSYKRILENGRNKAIYYRDVDKDAAAVIDKFDKMILNVDAMISNVQQRVNDFHINVNLLEAISSGKKEEEKKRSNGIEVRDIIEAIQEDPNIHANAFVYYRQIGQKDNRQQQLAAQQQQQQMAAQQQQQAGQIKPPM